MKIKISNEITIIDPTQEVRQWVYDKLKVPNPEYANKLKMGLWIGNTPKELKLYRVSGNNIIIPYGAYKSLYNTFPYLRDIVTSVDLSANKHVN